MKRYFLTLTFLLVSFTPVAAQVPSISAEIERVTADIRAAEAENAKYSGGLVKALIEARIATLKQTKAMLEQRKAAADFNIALSWLFTSLKLEVRSPKMLWLRLTRASERT